MYTQSTTLLTNCTGFRWKAKEKAEAAASAEATEATEAESRAQELQKQQAREGLRGGAPVDIKIVLLGAGESGKTTIFKNLQLIYGTRDFSKEGDWKLKVRSPTTREVGRRA